MFSIILQTNSFDLHTVDFTEDAVHGAINLRPLVGLKLWKRRVLEDPAGAVLHQEEGGADDTRATSGH